MLRQLALWIRTRLGITTLYDDAAGRAAETAGLRRQVDQLIVQIGEIHTALNEMHEALKRVPTDQSALWNEISLATTWAQSAPIRNVPTISVVLATRDRSAMLRQAIESVLAQSLHDWQLVVVDDGSTDDTPEVLATFAADSRVLPIAGTGAGAGAARNLGIAHATGQIVAFLDDDNLMGPDWLRAIAEYCSRVPSCEALYGAQLRRWEEPDRTGLYLLYVAPFDSDRLAKGNYIDLGQFAVRRDHPMLRFDESLEVFIDWEMIVRVARATPPHAVPVLASLYTTDAAGRLSTNADKDLRLREMRATFAATLAEALPDRA